MLIDIHEICPDISFGEDDVYSMCTSIENDSFALIRELLSFAVSTRDEVYSLRKEVNEYAVNAGVEIPYPYPAEDLPHTTMYTSQLVKELYEALFAEELSF
jgi:hypothetical protein